MYYIKLFLNDLRSPSGRCPGAGAQHGPGHWLSQRRYDGGGDRNRYSAPYDQAIGNCIVYAL